MLQAIVTFSRMEDAEEVEHIRQVNKLFDILN